MTTITQSGRRKTTIEIDIDLLARAQEVLGTKGVKETVDKALEEVWRTHLRLRFLERLQTQQGVDIGPEMLEETRAGWTKWAQ
jgi:Arc/MetJ family transcription regulator